MGLPCLNRGCLSKKTAVRSTKQLLIRCKLKNEDYQTALAGLRDTTTENGYTPKQILFGAPQQTDRQDDQSSKEQEEYKTVKQSKKGTDKKKEVQQDNLDIGDKVLIKHHKTGRWNKEAEVIEQRQDKLSYAIKSNPGKKKKTTQTKTCANHIRPGAV